MSNDFEKNLRTRIREELQRLGLSFAEASRVMGEKDSLGIRDVCNGRKRATAELVHKLSCIGVNLQYIYTGDRTKISALNPGETILQDNYRNISEEEKDAVNVTSIGERLKEERNRLGLSQEEFGKLGGVKKLTQFNYEKGERHPDSAYLEALAKIGVDVTYLLTGARFNGALTLTPDETILLDNYRKISDEEKDALKRIALALATTKTLT